MEGRSVQSHSAPDGEQFPLLAVSELRVSFPVGSRMLDAVRSVSFTVDTGVVYALVGESGCGKSTLARTICGMYRPAHGNVRFRGIDVHGATKNETRQIRKALQLLFQEALPSLNPRHTIRRILWEPQKANEVSKRMADAETAMIEQLAAVGLPHSTLDKFPRDFSGGQQQRIALARVLLLQPLLIIADEPVSALDVSVQAQVVHLLERLRKEKQLTYVLISHDLPLVSQIADHVGVMYLGEFVETGPARDVVTDPLHPYTAALRSATPVARISEIKRERIILRGEPPSALDPPPGCPFHERCPIARSICTTNKPHLAKRDDRRQVACHFPGELK